MDDNSELVSLKLEKLAHLEQRDRLRVGLPHKHRDKEYAWSRKLINSNAHRLICTAANQTGKSTSGAKRVIDFITDTDRWAERWPGLHARGGKPTRGWALYPDSKTSTAEFEDKWMPLLPQGEFKESPQYGWAEHYSNGRIASVVFNNGFTLEFRTYSQDASNLQAGSLALLHCDEELPFHLYPELALRCEAQDGYMSFVFTATLGQSEWREIVEDRTQWLEDDVEIMQISMYDCQFFEDGSAGLWPEFKIERMKRRLSTEAEIQRRVYGRFVVDSGLKYPTFVRSQHIIKGHPVPRSWLYYAGVDYGGGGDETSKTSHPSAIGILAVCPNFRRARIVKTWRGDGELTTADDVIRKYIQMTHGLTMITAFFDWAAKDLGTIAQRLGLPFAPAEKSHEVGEATVNTLFKNNALKIYDNSGDTEKLARELEGLLKSTNKKSAKDDLIDASCRYATTKIPWDMEYITKALPEEAEPATPTPSEDENNLRRGLPVDKSDDLEAQDDVDSELYYWSSQY